MTKKDRDIVFMKFGGKCAYCGCDLSKGWHLDHMEAVRRIYTTESVQREKVNWDGTKYMSRQYVTKYKGMSNPHLDTIDNAMPSCAKCNINKHGDSIEQFRKSISGYLKSLNLRMVQYQMAKKYGLVQETDKPVIFYFETIAALNTTKQQDNG